MALLGIFGWGLFAATLVPALGLGLCWGRGTRAAALGSMGVGLGVTLLGELLGFFRVYSLPGGVLVSGVALAASLLTYLVISGVTRQGAAPPDSDLSVIIRM